MDSKDPVSSATSVPPGDPDTLPITRKPLPLLTRFTLGLKVWALKTLVVITFKVIRFKNRAKFRLNAPTYTKRYPVRPTLESRVFIPKNYTPGSKLPLYLDIHGGGFVLCDPAIDDPFCRYFADTFGFCVVSLDHRLAPANPFPVPVNDCAELARAVLADPDLPVDHDKVVIGGFSAGGNLSLGVAQFEDLRPRIKAVIPVYPVTDFSGRYRGEYKTTKDGKEDVLKSLSAMFNWAYIPVGTDRRNPLLSSVYATRETLPKKIHFVAAEDDVLCDEAKAMAKKLAGIENEADRGPSWSQDGIRWEMLADQQHGFAERELKGEAEIKRKEMLTGLYQRIHTWIQQEVFQK